MCDHILMTDGSGLFLAGPALVQAAIGQKTSAERSRRGKNAFANQRQQWIFVNPMTTRASSEFAAWLNKIGAPNPSPFSHTKAREPLFSAEEIYGIFSSDPGKQYDIREIIVRIVDAGEFEEYRAESGQTLLCGYSRIGAGPLESSRIKKTCADAGARFGPEAHGIWRRDLHRVRGKSRAIYSGLQPESHPAGFFSTM